MPRPSLRARFTGFTLAGMVLVFVFIFVIALSLTNAKAQSASPSTLVEHPAGNAGADLGKESHEPVEDEQTQFKHSASVQWVARLTGLSLEQAYLLCVFFNFAVMVGTIVYFSKKNLPSVFRGRTASIQKAMQEARQASLEANQRLAEIETRLSRLDAEIANMGAAAEKEAVAEEARIKVAAEEDARRIVESAEQEISAAVKSARRELTEFAANLAVSLAAKQIKVDPATDQALVREFARELSTTGADSAGPTGKDGN